MLAVQPVGFQRKDRIPEFINLGMDPPHLAGNENHIMGYVH